VIVPTYTFIATAEAVSAVGATPRLVDVDAETALITAEIVEAALTSRTRCVIPVHLFGQTVEMDPLLALCRERGIAVVEDACQAHGARYRGRPVGSLGDAGCFSFYPTKNLGGWGDGGALVTHDAALAERVRLLRSHGEAVRHHHELATGTDRLDGLQAAILAVKLRHLADWNQRRRAEG
jgi:Predicted pyridoxal phosphate-dependent enzyme apparently involved in regulation of cell wall biogenesis